MSDSNGRRRVVITGLGMVSPIGNDVETSWKNLLAGESGADEITLFDTTDYPVHFACEAKDFQPTNWIEHKQARRMDRFAQFTIAAARMAEADSGLDVAKELGSRNVRANVVAPGYVTTRLTEVLPEEATKAMLDNTALGRLGEPADVAGAVRFLCSDEAAFITGAVLLVDGGLGM